MKLFGLIVAGTVAGAVLLGGLLYFGPIYKVWTSEQNGKAKLAEAEFSRQAQVEDAKAKLESAQYLKQAADEIESSLSPAYLEYLRIQMMEEIGRENPNAVYFDINGQTPQLTVPANKAQ